MRLTPYGKDHPVTGIARLRIELEGMDDRVIRRIEVPLAMRLDALHLVFQAAMGWENYHLYEFRIGRSVRYGIPDPGWPDAGLRSAKKATLSHLLVHAKQGKTIHYVYDFGDEWLHTVRLEAVGEADPGVTYPRLLEAEGRCPPEDCGGAGGYAHFLDAISDPNHEDHQEMIDWRGPGFDPKIVDEDAIRNAFALLGAPKRRRRKAGATKKKKTGRGIS